MPWIALALLIMTASPGGAEPRTWVVDEADEFAAGVARGVRVHPDSLVILASLTGDENLALGQTAVDEFGNEVPLCDGSVALVRSEWISGTPNVFGRNFTVDLGVDRAIDRVRIVAGQTAQSQPEYFVRGYRLEAAAQGAPEVWHLLAEQPANFRLTVDTRRDSTWGVVDGRGEPVPRLGRYVRLTLIRQDRSNWVSLGEIEVYGVGRVNEGAIEDGFSPPTPVNVGRIRWQAEDPEDTRIDLRVRGATASRPAPAWEEVAPAARGEFTFEGDEPIERFEYQALLRNEAPFATPALRRVEVEYDPVLVARELLGEVAGPDTIRKGVETALVYRAQADVAAGDYGLDLLRLRGVNLEVEAVRVDGRELTPDPGLREGFRAVGSAQEEETVIELAAAERVGSPATIEIVGRTLFLKDRTPVAVEGGSRQQSERDGYVNWQRGREAPGGSWTALAGGAPLRLLGRVEVNPRPFSPYSGEELGFDVVVSHIEDGRDVTLRIYRVDGRRVRQQTQTGRARAYRFAWDGRDEDEAVVAPGLYLYEVTVRGSGAAQRGTFVVAY